MINYDKYNGYWVGYKGIISNETKGEIGTVIEILDSGVYVYIKFQYLNSYKYGLIKVGRSTSND